MRNYKCLIYIIFLFACCTQRDNDIIELKIVSAQSIYFNSNNPVDTTLFKREFEDWIKEKNEKGKAMPKILFEVNPNVNVDVSKHIKQILRKYHNEIILAYPTETGEHTLVKLPPPLSGRIDYSFIKRRNRFHLIISGENIYRDTVTESTQITKEELVIKSKQFIKGNPLDSLLPELKMINLPGIGKVNASPKHVFIIEHYPVTTYGQYTSVLDVIRENYKKDRNENSVKYYGLEYFDLGEKEKEIINRIAPVVISEL